MAKLDWEKQRRYSLVKEKGSDRVESEEVKKTKEKFTRQMKSAFDGNCKSCNKKIKKGSKILYYYKEHITTHLLCPKPRL